MDFSFHEHQDNLVRKLYRNVSNTKEIRKLIFSAKLPFTLLKPKLIVDPLQISVAVTKALYNMKEGTMITRSLPTEIIYALSPSKNITESLNTFSAQDDDTSILILGEKQLFQKLQEQIQGEEIPLGSISELSDINLIKNVFQIPDEELTNSNVLDSIISRMASKEYVSLSIALHGSSLKRN